jgi:hypothetical protein
MPDEAEKMKDKIDEATDKTIQQIRSNSKIIPGTPGDCELCGHWSSRLINGVCPPCRDKYGLP